MPPCGDEVDMPSVLIVDQSDAVCRICGLILAEFGFAVQEASNTLDAMMRCQAENIDVVIVDSALPGALDLVQNLRLLPNSQRLNIFYSVSKADLRTLMAAKTAGANDVVLKPFDRKALREVFSRISISAAA